MVLPLIALARSVKEDLSVIPAAVGDVLPQHQLDQRAVDEVGDGEKTLALRGGAQKYRAGADGEIRAAGDDGIDRGDADQIAVGDLQAFRFIETRVFGDEGCGKRKRRSWQRNNTFDFLCAGRGGQQSATSAAECAPASRVDVMNMDVLPCTLSVEKICNRRVDALQWRIHAAMPHRQSAMPKRERCMAVLGETEGNGSSVLSRHSARLRGRGDQVITFFVLIAHLAGPEPDARRLLGRLAMGRADAVRRPASSAAIC